MDSRTVVPIFLIFLCLWGITGMVLYTFFFDKNIEKMIRYIKKYRTNSEGKEDGKKTALFFGKIMLCGPFAWKLLKKITNE